MLNTLIQLKVFDFVLLLFGALGHHDSYSQNFLWLLFFNVPYNFLLINQLRFLLRKLDNNNKQFMWILIIKIKNFLY